MVSVDVGTVIALSRTENIDAADILSLITYIIEFTALPFFEIVL